MGAIALAGREQLDNLIWVVNCNLQRLDPGQPARRNQGNMQALPNGACSVGWGHTGQPDQAQPRRRVVFDAAPAAPATSYRAYCFAWSGFAWSATPTCHRAITSGTQLEHKVTIFASRVDRRMSTRPRLTQCTVAARRNII